ncbi:3-oxoacyl-[acyl-carrier protein] reductase [Desulfuromusa kysingii]|uniref:3-oxoacyl-[acyl-carrier protein] reductase n=1 Tax=Desulfuromusa kysingii TaxID=37625 RepID=A0A1H3X2L6_9BACT|nr:SDR family oxidoreductase [Desulfuromusa kysingii]SDZ93636.1 3-oxoacyl-[acyl-carrier protein] reductase [Desulfuromusa kysingii]
MDKSLTGKTALVTGGSRGIGRATALKLGAMGAAVVVNYMSNTAAAEDVVDKIVAQGGKAVAIKANMVDPAAIETLFDQAIHEFGGLDIVVNNAGLAIYKPIAEVTEDDYEQLFSLNVKGLLFSCQQAARKLADGGRIINISTSVTKMMLPNYGLYAASKGAVEELTKVLAKELGARGITVNAISPGPTDTDLFRQGKSEEQIRQLGSMAAFNRIGTPEDIAGAVALLASPESGWITGQDICANGGLTA